MNTATVLIAGEGVVFPAFINSCRNITVGCSDLRLEMISNLIALDSSPIAILIASTAFLLCFGLGVLTGWMASTVNICLVSQASRPRPRQRCRPAIAKKRSVLDDGSAASFDDLPLPPLPVLDGAAVEEFFQDNIYESE